MTILLEYIIIIFLNHGYQLISLNIPFSNNTAIAVHKLATVP